ncbi:hypothetical protein PPL_12235 [Heterostelium album PN500]|uniref:Uncharacterized protein n=1 Tax=Heterostelium pallidum (strain ATCC 26659 / Pp 5 / PN500) TaxID=670386 RepID=D3BM27_HETP5|nr:hypothetical protein PPL_12235 [Heterostelium album PN500]EFA77628.1 hypothetical protein PPL_12235 [Heterostelium album PN500]|eukprot:XP_020429756.1 hypothetical protein PPL_12235 [Heterostelium album PN500]
MKINCSILIFVCFAITLGHCLEESNVQCFYHELHLYPIDDFHNVAAIKGKACVFHHQTQVQFNFARKDIIFNNIEDNYLGDDVGLNQLVVVTQQRNVTYPNVSALVERPDDGMYIITISKN